MEKQTTKRHIADTWPVVILVTLCLMFIGEFVGYLIVSYPMDQWLVQNVFPTFGKSEAWKMARMYLMFIGIGIVVYWAMASSKKNGPMRKQLGIESPGKNVVQLVAGLVLGFGLNGLCIFIAYVHNDIELSFMKFQPLPCLIIFLAVFIQSSAEELLCRGYLFRRLLNSYHKPVIAIGGNALFFACLHLLNTGVTVLSVINIFLSGVLFSIIVYYTKSLLGAFALHAAWNFNQNIIFGLPNSGIETTYSIMKLNRGSARNSFAYDTVFGIEGTIVADIVLAIACIALYLWFEYKKRSVAEEAV